MTQHQEKRAPLIGITMGDFNGISPEVIIKALHGLREKSLNCIIIGSAGILRSVNKSLGNLFFWDAVQDVQEFRFNPDRIPVLDIFNESDMQPNYGVIDRTAGKAAGMCIEYAIKLALDSKIQAIVTGPVSKKALSLAGYHYPGQTEFLADRTNTRDVVMMLVTQTFRVALATTHCAVQEISGMLSVDHIERVLQIVNTALREYFLIQNPRIAVTSLNPHAGENGLFGREELDIIEPALAMIRQQRIAVDGPFPADTLFARDADYDAYLAMYHDQGLVPFKMKAFGKGVNYTAGLPIIRTSPDHGTAFDIVGKNIADEHSMMEAIVLANQLAQNRTYRSTI